MADFQDFEIKIGKGRAGYRASVSSSVFAFHDFSPPFQDEELDRLLAQAGVYRDVPPTEEIPADAIGDLGAILFDRVFGGEVRRAWDKFQGEVRASGNAIRLCLLLEDPELWGWPWEFLRDPRNDFLALSPGISIVRCPTSLKPLPSRNAEPPLRVLCVSAHPKRTQKLSFEHEWKNLTANLEELEKAGKIELNRIEHATASLLRRELKKPWDVLHFVGHGDFSRRRGEGVLLFEKENGERSEVSGKVLARILRRQEPRPRLIVLNACEGGRPGKTDPFAGVAQRLAREGISAVVAMQFKVSDQAAVVFSEAFYEAFSQGAPVDRAVYEGRLALHSEGFEAEWGTPVLYMRFPEEGIGTPGGVGGNETKDRHGNGETEIQWPRTLMKAVAFGVVASGLLGGAYWVSTRPEISSHPDCPSPSELGMSFVKMEPGKFMMGSGSNQRAVTISKPFCMSRFEVTQEQWQKVVGSVPTQRKAGKRFPVGNVSWYDVQKFLSLLNRRQSGARYRLPTEAEWEYAARAGTSETVYFEGGFEALPRYANCNRSKAPSRVGSNRKNPWGLYDMYGNISEWVADWAAPLPKGAATNPIGPETGDAKVRRGGSFDYGARCNSTYRVFTNPNAESDDVGFRIVRDPSR